MHARDVSTPEPGHRSPYRPVHDAAPGASVGPTPSRPASTPPSALITDSYQEGPRKVVVIRGEVDYETAPAVSAALRTALRASGEGVDLDLRAVRFWDCSGLNALLRLRREALAHGKTVTVRSPSRAVRRVLGLTGTASLFRPPHLRRWAVEGRSITPPSRP
ncbi:STAS domain-containing protein [Streptomyces sp. NEAU-YJ-81]|uniref:STAS domain-containing protein n=1 Tax=Streptomyces sp. NEAU-YJ-81 TaxID=2820288 RepID=UPI001ABBEEBC|nr:STAS domain-containing protein [Streptomyces sp. NEAU-YJ-81]MBO3679489.1 STAS domain-containing protein [Streptomyces sp. NEAU-YJ-81]